MRKKLQQQFRMAWLMVVNLAKVRQLQVLEIHTERRFAGNSTRTDLYWVTKGCHKIRVDGHGTFPGDVTGISILERPVEHHVTVSFIGWSNTYTHVFPIPSSLQGVLHKFRDELETHVDKKHLYVANALNNQVRGWQFSSHIKVSPFKIFLNSALPKLTISITMPKFKMK